MSELDLYKFIHNTYDNGGAISVEVSWRGEELICWLSHFDLDDFCKLISDYLEDNYDFNVTLLKNSEICFPLNDICEYYEIELENILSKSEE